MARRKALLLGNGINCLGKSGLSWEDVLRTLLVQVGIGCDQNCDPNYKMA